MRRFFLGLLAAVIAAGWLRVLPESLWLDECGTVFVISGTWAELLARKQIFVLAYVIGLGVVLPLIMFRPPDLGQRIGLASENRMSRKCAAV